MLQFCKSEVDCFNRYIARLRLIKLVTLVYRWFETIAYYYIVGCYCVIYHVSAEWFVSDWQAEISNHYFIVLSYVFIQKENTFIKTLENSFKKLTFSYWNKRICVVPNGAILDYYRDVLLRKTKHRRIADFTGEHKNKNL